MALQESKAASHTPILKRQLPGERCLVVVLFGELKTPYIKYFEIIYAFSFRA